jgi:GT2 family glycosyltransferase
MTAPLVTVAVPTLASGAPLADCIGALRRQTLSPIDIVVIDNSGCDRAPAFDGVRLMRNASNRGYGAAANQAWLSSAAPFCAVINDDAIADPRWLESLVAALLAHPAAGMAAAQVRLAGTGVLDSAGLAIARDGSSVQRAHRTPDSPPAGEVLLPSGAAALFRRQAVEQTGGFDEDFFLYCEDTDLGLRVQQRGWSCLYVPQAIVDHHYSASSGAVSPLKAYLVERNRLRLVVRNFPFAWLLAAPFASAVRYFWHLAGLYTGRGKAAEFAASGQPAGKLVWYVMKAHLALLPALPRLLRQRAPVPASLLRRFAVSLREVAGH